MKRFLLPLLFFALVIPMFVVALSKDPTALPSTFLGKAAPAFELPQLQDQSQTVTKDNFARQDILVNFWATWCVGCRQEHQFLLQLAANNTIPVYGINWRDQRSEALRWLATLGDPYTLSAFDGENHAGIDWGVYAAPETFLIDGSGTVVYKHLGPLNRRVWQQEFVPRLSDASGATK